MLLAMPEWLKLKGMAGHWLVQHTAPIIAKPDGMQHLERHITNTRKAAHFLHIPPPPNTSCMH